jgi:Immunity protein 8
MRALVRNFISPDIDLDDFKPDNPAEFSFLLQALVGPDDSEGEESLQFLVCTPRALERRVASEGIVFGRPLVIVESPDISRILDAVRGAVERPEALSWDALCRRLERLGIYEFEDC